VLALGASGAAGALAGCQVYGGEAAQRPPPPPPPPPPATPAPGASEDGSGETADPSEELESSGTVIAATGDVAVGGGLVLEDYNVVVTQPAEGDFRAFSATCTHQGCLVSEVSDGTIDCLCHGSKFSIEDGSVVQAAQGLSADEQAPLPQAGIVVNGDAIELPA
jgi:Rieske Fe-S protein